MKPIIYIEKVSIQTSQVHKLTIDEEALASASTKSPTTTRAAGGLLMQPRDMINAETSKLITLPPTVTIDDVKRREDRMEEQKEQERMLAREEKERERERQMVLEASKSEDFPFYFASIAYNLVCPFFRVSSS